nr:immunoglobulin light chain junction region [Macaca mulatta]
DYYCSSYAYSYTIF